MSTDQAVDLGRNAVQMALLIGAPVLLVGMLVGLIIGLAQALTQIQDQTIAFVPKIVAMFLTLTVSLPWLIQRMTEYFTTVIGDIPRILGTG